MQQNKICCNKKNNNQLANYTFFVFVIDACLLEVAKAYFDFG
jgi:hypothetical protein